VPAHAVPREVHSFELGPYRACPNFQGLTLRVTEAQRFIHSCAAFQRRDCNGWV